MASNSNRNGLWTADVWNTINTSVKAPAMGIGVAQTIFQATQLPNVTSFPADLFDPERISIAEGMTKPYTEISVSSRRSVVRSMVIYPSVGDLVAWRLCEACLDVEAASIMLFE
jgi:hypothetical protein